MKKLTLRQMNPAQAREHYERLAAARVDRAFAEFDHVLTAPRNVRGRLVASARKTVDKAFAWRRPQAWHIDRATKLRETYGIGVAAAFLAAHGWSFDAAHNILF